MHNQTETTTTDEDHLSDGKRQHKQRFQDTLHGGCYQLGRQMDHQLFASRMSSCSRVIILAISGSGKTHLVEETGVKLLDMDHVGRYDSDGAWIWESNVVNRTLVKGSVAIGIALNAYDYIDENSDLVVFVWLPDPQLVLARRHVRRGTSEVREPYGTWMGDHATLDQVKQELAQLEMYAMKTQVPIDRSANLSFVLAALDLVGLPNANR